MFDFILSFFSNIFNILFCIIFTAIGILLGIIIVRYLLRPKNQVLYCRERDGRGQELDIDAEDGISLETDSDPQLRFFKYGRSYEFNKRGRSFTKFFGKEGTAYTWRLQGFGGSKDEPKQLDIEFPTLEEAVRTTWGNEFYRSVPEKMQEKLRENRLLVTVNLEPGIVPEGYTPITEQTIKKKANEDMAALLSKALQGALKEPLVKWIFMVGTGFGLGWIIHSLVM